MLVNLVALSLTQSIPFKRVKKDYYVMMTNANKNNYVIYFHLPSGDLGAIDSITTLLTFHM